MIGDIFTLSDKGTGGDTKWVMLIMKDHGWEQPSSALVTGLSFSHVQSQQAPYHKNWINGDNRETMSSGGSTIPEQAKSHIDSGETDEYESFDRVTLLAKKYATENMKLTKEESARLEVIHQRMDQKHLRFSDRDWQLIDEVDSLIDEFSNQKDLDS